jgi:hypothetical protein
MSQKSCTRGHPKKKIRQRVKRAKTSVAKRNVNVWQDCKHPSDLKKVSWKEGKRSWKEGQMIKMMF